MNFNEPVFSSTAEAKTLIVLLHAYRSNHDDLAGLISVMNDYYKIDNEVIDVYAPSLPYQNWWDWSGAIDIVVRIVEDLDEIWQKRKYDHVIFIGHSLGGILLRRIFLAGAPNPPDYSGDYLIRDDLPKAITENRHEWVIKIERIILLATWDKGWSISERDAWKYTLGLNLLGFWGRFSELFGLKAKPGRTMLDMRQGASFIVQTRLLWMAYSRWHSAPLRLLYNNAHPVKPLKRPPPEAINPLLIQIIGTKDDFVSPQNQVDYDITAAAMEAAKKSESQPRNYFLLEMKGANHAGVISFKGDEGEYSKSVFLTALTGDHSNLKQLTQNPSYFEDTPIKPDPTVQDVAFVMHGIRDDGYWTHRIAKAIKEAAEYSIVSAGHNVTDPMKSEHTVSWTQTYGYFPMGAFLLPWIRQRKVEWFMDKYVNIKTRYPNATMHYVGHSNGTYLASRALDKYPAARFGRVYFAGSVVHPKFDWTGKVTSGRVKQFHNVRGATDWVVALLPKSIEYSVDLGGAGFDGFELEADKPDEITQSDGYVKGGHSGAIGEEHWPEIAKFIVTGEKPFISGEPSELFETKQNNLLCFLARFRIGIPLIFSLVALLILFGFSLWLPYEHWKWGTSDITGGWGGIIWGCALATFLALQYYSKNAPTPAVARFSLLLMCVIGLGIANLVFTTFFYEAFEFAKLDAYNVAVAFRTAGAILTIGGFIALLRFILTRF